MRFLGWELRPQPEVFPSPRLGCFVVSILCCGVGDGVGDGGGVRRLREPNPALRAGIEDVGLLKLRTCGTGGCN